MTEGRILQLFEGYGIELEYMMVAPHDLAPLAISDRVLQHMAGHPTMSVERGEIAWSNELAMHVIEIKSNGPKPDLLQLHHHMLAGVRALNRDLQGFGATLLPTAMHPFFDPEENLKLWDHDDSEIYAAYHRIFSCKGHGWANLQSIHVNLPFASDEEFGRLHTAIRLVLPLLPALAASSPIVEGRVGPIHDNRVAYYLQNQRRIASIIGAGIPEAVRNKAEYFDVILNPMFQDIAPHDPEGDLQHEWLNSRAAIARFERNAIEIRLLDIQECLRADFAIITAVVGMIKALVEESWSSFEDQFAHSHHDLRAILDGVLQTGGDYEIIDRKYLRAFGARQSTTVKALLQSALGRLPVSGATAFAPYRDSMTQLLQNGNLSTRILRALGPNPDRSAITAVYQELARCLMEDRMFGVP